MPASREGPRGAVQRAFITVRAEWVREGRVEAIAGDGAGKGGTIKAMTERVSPRIFRVVALPAPFQMSSGQH